MDDLRPVAVQAALDLEEGTPGTDSSVPGVVESFSFDGRDYVAHIAPAFGVRLRVKPILAATRGRDVAIAYHAFRQRYRAHIEEVCARAWPARRRLTEG